MILVIDQYSLILCVTSEEYGVDNVTISVEWTRHLGAAYNITVVPLEPVLFTGANSSQLTISYNTEYNLNVEATDLCRFSRANSTAFNFITLK